MAIGGFGGSDHDDFTKRMREKMVKQGEGAFGGEMKEGVSFKPKPGFKADGSKKSLIPRVMDKLQHHADNKTLTKKIQGMFGSKGADVTTPSTPEAGAGHATFLEKTAPKLAQLVAGAPQEQVAAVARKHLETTVAGDPDSLFHHLGNEEMKNQARKRVDALLEGF